MLELRHDQNAAIATPYTINPDLDRAAIRAEYEATGQVRIYGLLSDGAVQLYEHLQAREDWIHLINKDGGVHELKPADKAALSEAEWAEMTQAAHVRARDAFQYRYHALRVPTPEEMGSLVDPITDFARFMGSVEMLAFLRDLTGHDELDFTDGQATAYEVGDFLTGHDDAVPGKGRIAAYVFGLTPYWRLEYGGLLLFHGPSDRTVTGHVPRFNTLDLFKVPQQHSVSMVTPSAPHRRLAVTGWLRSSAAQS